MVTLTEELMEDSRAEALLRQVQAFNSYANAADEYRYLSNKYMKRDRPCRGTRMYIVVGCPFLTPAQRAVQSSHAVAGFMDKYGSLQSVKKWVRTYKTMTILDGQSSLGMKIKATMSGLKYFAFREPDLGRMITAIAFEPITKSRGDRLFSEWNLMK